MWFGIWKQILCYLWHNNHLGSSLIPMQIQSRRLTMSLCKYPEAETVPLYIPFKSIDMFTLGGKHFCSYFAPSLYIITTSKGLLTLIYL
ncbi:hypothetical protein GLYMA_12G154600v4 [Glycine max]|uniref:Uncharacterized protein n=1 Tax=Glycine max TaxID=3847 RepID=K7LV39_SOYBN|nr:hypothetical protein GYH30_033852 [Glycine max]KRH26143.1 hypothetical protein GLYMA_12G154600v4 [Glycine max]